MAALPPIKRLAKEDFPEAPKWVDRFLYPLNLFMDSVYAALSRTLTFEENILSQKEKFQIRAGATPADNVYTFSLRMKAKPEMLFLGQCVESGDDPDPIEQPIHVEWLFDGVNVQITSVYGLTSGTLYDFTVLLTP